jgi:hypothetical protein
LVTAVSSGIRVMPAARNLASSSAMSRRPRPCRLAEVVTSSVMTCPSVAPRRQPSTNATMRLARSTTIASAVFAERKARSSDLEYAVPGGKHAWSSFHIDSK